MSEEMKNNGSEEFNQKDLMKKMSEIKSRCNDIRKAEEFSEKRIEMIEGNTAYIDYNMIQKEKNETKDRVERMKKVIEDEYKGVNPELAALRTEEREKVEKGMDPRQAQKERREAVKTYYNKKSQREM